MNNLTRIAALPSTGGAGMADRPELTQCELKRILSYDPETGVFRWRVSRTGNVTVGQIAGSKTHGYLSINILKKSYGAHRLAWFYVHGEWPYITDHINGNRSDNRISNLRNADYLMNLHNRDFGQTRAASGYRGVTVSRRAGAFEAYIVIDGKKRYLGTFDDAAVAHSAYIDAARKFQRGFVEPALRGCA